MPIKTILAILTTPERAKPVLDAAIVVAERHGAHLIALHVMESLMVYPGVAMSGATADMSAFEHAERAKSRAVKEAFQSRMATVSFSNEWRLVRRGGDPIGSRALESGRAADLIVVPQSDDPAERYIVDTILRGAGRPVLLVPPGFTGGPLGRTLLIGWSATREATRAAFDTLSYAEDGASGFLMSVSRGTRPAPSIEAASKDLAVAFDRHGLSMTIVHRPSNGGDVAELLMREAFERGADTIVSGAYGHSLAYDFVVGAVTRDLMEKSQIPVLFSK